MHTLISLREVVTTSYVGATDTEGSCVLGVYQGTHTIQNWDYSLTPLENHETVCRLLAKTGKWVGMGTETGYIWVCYDLD